MPRSAISCWGMVSALHAGAIFSRTGSCSIGQTLTDWLTRRNLRSGHSLAESDEHILRLIDKGKMNPVVIGLYGDPHRRESSDYRTGSGDRAKERLALQTQGFAHVVLMPWELGYKWTEMVGKPWSAYLGAVRTYQPGLDFELDSPDMHPRAFADRILFFRYNGLEAEEAFTSFLIDQAAAQAASKRVHWTDRCFVTDARTKQAELARLHAQEDEDWRGLYEAEIASRAS